MVLGWVLGSRFTLKLRLRVRLKVTRDLHPHETPNPNPNPNRLQETSIHMKHLGVHRTERNFYIRFTLRRFQIMHEDLNFFATTERTIRPRVRGRVRVRHQREDHTAWG